MKMITTLNLKDLLITKQGLNRSKSQVDLKCHLHTGLGQRVAAVLLVSQYNRCAEMTRLAARRKLKMKSKGKISSKEFQ